MKKVHRYLGLTISFILLVVSLTGVMLVWKKEYLWVTIPAARELPIAELDLAEVARTIEKNYAKDEVRFVRFYAEGLSVHKVFLSERRYAWHDQSGGQVQVWANNERFEDWLLDLHHRLLLGNSVGLQIVGFSGLLMLPLMLLGLLIWWPWRKSYRFNLVPANSSGGALRKSHFDTGATVLLPALLIVITGVILVYPDQARFVIRDGFGEPASIKRESVPIVWQNNKARYAQAFDFIQRSFPAAQPRWLSYPVDGSPVFSIGIQEQGSWNRTGATSLQFQRSSVLAKRLSEQRTTEAILDYSYPLHTGQFPTWYRLLLSATGLLLAWLALLGLLANRKRR